MRDLLEKDTEFARNIYVISSPGDYQYEQEVKHYLPALRSYENFNFLFVDSPPCGATTRWSARPCPRS
ncbi:hypothetical protein ACFQV4_08060 [Streptomyces thermocarboxydus]